MTEEKRLLLSDICQEYFGITEVVANRKALKGALPVTSFRLNTRKGAPWYVRQIDLDAHVFTQCELARPENVQKRRAETPPPVPKQTSLYRHFNSSGILLYVGISISVFSRIATHRTGSHWSDEICRIDVQRYPSWEAAYEAETQAIRKEKPLHNKAKVAK